MRRILLLPGAMPVWAFVPVSLQFALLPLFGGSFATFSFLRKEGGFAFLLLLTEATFLLTATGLRLAGGPKIPLPKISARGGLRVLPFAFASVSLALLGGALEEWLSRKIGGPDSAQIARLLREPPGLAGALLAWVGAALAPAVCEELLFRGQIQPLFARRLSPWMALSLTTVLFAAIHLRPASTPSLLLVGFFLGWTVLESGHVGWAFLGHLLNNSLSVIALRLLPDEAMESTPWQVILAAMVVLPLGIGAWRRLAPLVEPDPQRNR